MFGRASLLVWIQLTLSQESPIPARRTRLAVTAYMERRIEINIISSDEEEEESEESEEEEESGSSSGSVKSSRRRLVLGRRVVL